MTKRQGASKANDESYHIRAVLLPHGTAPVDLWIEDGLVRDEPVPGAAKLPGRFVSPGLVDAHCHLSLDFSNTALPLHSAALVLHNAERNLRAGVTALRDAGYVQQIDPDEIELPHRPTVQRSGWLVVPKGRYFPGVDVGKETEPNSLESRVEQVAETGAEWFKFIADFPGPDLDLFVAPLNYEIEEVTRAVALAHRLGLRVMAHSTGTNVGSLIGAGVDAIEHGMSVTPDDVRSMAKLGVHWTPTVATVERFLRAAETRGASSEPRRVWSTRLRACLSLAPTLGVPVLVGTDELAHGEVAVEIDAMIRHGFDPEQAIDAATTTARETLGLPGLEPGAPADLVSWDRDPRTNPSILADPAAVIAAGRRVDLEAPLESPGTDVPARVRYVEAAAVARETCALGIEPSN